MVVLDAKHNATKAARGDPCPCHGDPMEVEPGSWAGACTRCGMDVVYTSGGHGGIAHAFEGRQARWPRPGASGRWSGHAPTVR